MLKASRTWARIFGGFWFLGGFAGVDSLVLWYGEVRMRGLETVEFHTRGTDCTIRLESEGTVVVMNVILTD